MPAVATAGRAVLRDYGGDGPPVIVVPSLINTPDVLDLSAANSMLRGIAAQGVHPFLLDWGTPGPEERDISIAGHVERFLLPLIAGLGGRPALAGYCLGGTMAIAATARADISALALIAAPWRFAGFPSGARSGLADLWAQSRPAAETMGLMPMEVLQTGFWQLDPARTVTKFERLGSSEPSAEALASFVALEDWANEGPPLTLASARELMIDFFQGDATGQGRWAVAGDRVSLGQIRCPVLDIVSTSDRIVPAASAAGIGTTLSLELGHVGMMVGRPARARLWNPLAAWLRDNAA